ncbi:hypothetical protein L1887_59463 [Cichorium endivia]|nr:hypothetical protein L1887_59463 [Cichorium endivia]
MLAEQQIALQQQIEMLQLQQQQLMQSAGLPRDGASANQAQRRLPTPSEATAGFRAHAPRSGPMGSFSTGNSFNAGLGANANFVPSPARFAATHASPRSRPQAFGQRCQQGQSAATATEETARRTAAPATP